VGVAVFVGVALLSHSLFPRHHKNMARVLVFGGVGELMSKIGDIELEDNVKFVKQTTTRNFGCDGTRYFTQTCIEGLRRHR